VRRQGAESGPRLNFVREGAPSTDLMKCLEIIEM
jgi:hypothetical protein